MAKMKFKIGDVVCLKSEDGYTSTKIKMTIKDIVGEYPNIQEIECIWLSKGGVIQTHKFNPLLLMH